MILKIERREANSQGRWLYLAVKKLSSVLRGITSKNYDDF